MDYALHILFLIGIYWALAASLNLLVMQAGLLSVAHATFFGLGAYTSALLTTSGRAQFVPALVAGVGVAVLASLVLSTSTIRLRGDYFAMATFAFQMVIVSVLNNAVDLTRGPLGIPGIPKPSLFGIVISTSLSYAVLALGLGVVAQVTLSRVVASPFGKLLWSLREDDTFATALGKNMWRVRLEVLGLGAGLAACAGSVFAHYLGYVDPLMFGPLEAVIILAMVIVGGERHRWGPFFGASLLIAVPELLRLSGLRGAAASHLRLMLFGVVLVAAVFVRAHQEKTRRSQRHAEG